MSRLTRLRARFLSARGAAFLRRDLAAAEAAYSEAVRLDPGLHVAWFDLGLVHKWSRRWDEAFDCNLRAAELIGEKADEPAWWNLGIAATALGRWDVARRAWRAYGVAVPDGAGAIEGDFGMSPVRLNPDGEPEVVWGRRIDPARMRLSSIPLPGSGHRWADIVLHDGVPKGHREHDGRLYPVFDELARWQPSDVPTIQASVHAERPDDVDALVDALDQAGHVAEDWTRNTRLLCKQCCEGVVHADHNHVATLTGPEHLIGIAGPLDAVTSVVRDWEQEPGRTCHAIDHVA